MEFLLVLIVSITIGLWVFIIWYIRASSKAFSRTLDRTLWRAWEAGRHRGDDDTFPPHKM